MPRTLCKFNARFLNGRLGLSSILFFILLSACSGAKNNVSLTPPLLVDTLFNLQEREREARCLQHLQDFHNPTSGSAAELIERELRQYQSLVEQALLYREQTIYEAVRLKQKIRAHDPLSGKDLDILNQGLLAHLDLRENLFQVAESHECLLSLPDKSLTALGITPQLRLQAVMMSVSAGLVLYDNYILAISIFHDDDKLRRIINTPDRGYEISRDILHRITLSYNSLNNRNRLRQGINFYEQEITNYQNLQQEKSALSYLNELITQSPSYSKTRKISPLRSVNQNLQFLETLTVDELNLLSKEGLNLFSMVFGNSIGLVETRHGKLYKRHDVVQTIRKELQVGDILLEKTPFRLTDKMIPGYWGHVAIWLGSEKELRALGIWQHPLVVSQHEKIRQGRAVVEALRGGVKINTLKSFLDVDDVAVLRMSALDKEAKIEIVLQTLRQVGKAYDFNFDVETTDRIVCSELVYQVYTAIDWPTQRTLGRSTISPDHVALKALNGGPLRLVVYYRDGKRVDQDPIKRLSMAIEQP